MHTSSSKRPYEQCSACTEGHKYSSEWEALGHLHSVHTECTRSAVVGSKNPIPAEDPCFVFLEASETGLDASEFNSIARATGFLSDLADVDNRLEKLHHLVAKPKPADHLANGEKTGKPATMVKPSSMSLPLPRSLVYAFEELLAYYLLCSRGMSAESEDIATHEHHSWIDQRSRHARRCLYRYLEQAASDICVFPAFVDTPGRHNDSSMAVDIKMLRPNTLSCTVWLSVMRTSIPTAAPKGLSGVHSIIQPHTKADELDVVAMYTEYCQRLRSKAARRPRRRLFMDITGLLDELSLLNLLLHQNLENIQG